MKVDRKPVTEDRFDENTKGFDVDPGDETLAKVHFQPSYLSKRVKNPIIFSMNQSEAKND